MCVRIKYDNLTYIKYKTYLLKGEKAFKRGKGVHLCLYKGENKHPLKLGLGKVAGALELPRWPM